MSIAGGFPQAVYRAGDLGCDCLQVFTKNRNQWRGRPIGTQEAQQFKEALSQTGVAHPLAHDSYLINLASPDKSLWRKSIRALIAELRRADRLGIPFLVAHPGAYIEGKEAAGLRRVALALDAVHAQTHAIRSICLLETTAGQGTSLGWKFEHLAAILDAVKDPDRLGVCFDTCHVFAAGYPLHPKAKYLATIDALQSAVGLKRIKAFHLNDSSRGLGSRVDRHEHIGRGSMGLGPFRWLLNDPRFRAVPMYLETPKGEENGEDLDRVNLATLRRLCKG